MHRSLLAWLLAAASSCAWPAQVADTWAGAVSHVTDGDTLWIRPDAGGAPRKIRLQGIDAPERCQAHGAAARDALKRHLQDRHVRVQPLHNDDYGRLLARVWLGDADVGAWLVREGHAWSDGFRRHGGPYAQDEAAARAARRGLFAQDEPQRPAAFRRQHGPCTD